MSLTGKFRFSQEFLFLSCAEEEFGRCRNINMAAPLPHVCRCMLSFSLSSAHTWLAFNWTHLVQLLRCSWVKIKIRLCNPREIVVQLLQCKVGKSADMNRCKSKTVRITGMFKQGKMGNIKCWGSSNPSLHL